MLSGYGTDYPSAFIAGTSPKITGTQQFNRRADGRALRMRTAWEDFHNLENEDAKGRVEDEDDEETESSLPFNSSCHRLKTIQAPGISPS
jgi:hypothetical protein